MLPRDHQLFILLISLLAGFALGGYARMKESLEETDAVWAQRQPEKPFPNVDFNTGYDTDGTPLFAARTVILRGLQIGYVRKGGKTAHFALFSYERTAKFFQVMTSATGKWVRQQDSQIPQNAIRVGGTSGEYFYLGRVYYKKGLFPAQVSSSTRMASFIYKGQQIDTSTYEILVSNWVNHLKGNKPENAFSFAKDPKTGESFYLVRTKFRGKVYPGVLKNGETGALVRLEKEALRFYQYEVLTGSYNLRDSHFIENEFPMTLGHDTKTYYLCIGRVNGELLPGRLSTKQHSKCNIYNEGELIRAKEFFYLSMC